MMSDEKNNYIRFTMIPQQNVDFTTTSHVFTKLHYYIMGVNAFFMFCLDLNA